MLSIKGLKDIFGLTISHLFFNKVHHPFGSFVSLSLPPIFVLVFDDDPSYFLYHVRIPASLLLINRQ